MLPSSRAVTCMSKPRLGSRGKSLPAECKLRNTLPPKTLKSLVYKIIGSLAFDSSHEFSLSLLSCLLVVVKEKTEWVEGGIMKENRKQVPVVLIDAGVGAGVGDGERE